MEPLRLNGLCGFCLLDMGDRMAMGLLDGVHLRGVLMRRWSDHCRMLIVCTRELSVNNLRKFQLRRWGQRSNGLPDCFKGALYQA